MIGSAATPRSAFSPTRSEKYDESEAILWLQMIQKILPEGP